MILSTLIRKGGLARLATATPATVATQTTLTATTVAEVATVAVAEQREASTDLEALDRELRGQKVFPLGEENQRLMEVSATLDDLDRVRQEAGLNLNELNNEQIRNSRFNNLSPDAMTQGNYWEFRDTERAYGGREEYERAKTCGKTKLNYVQWLQVRTPAFKRWFGDWEIASSEPARQASTFVEARDRAKVFQGAPLTNPATGIVATVSRNNLDKMLNETAVGKSETPAIHSLAVANLDNLFERAILGWSKPDSEGDPNIKEIHRFFAPITVEGKAMLAKMTVKETVDPAHANGLYTVESVVFEAIKNPAAQWVDASANADGVDLTSIRSAGLIRSMAQSVQDFNADTVSKVTDPETGEPLAEAVEAFRTDFEGSSLEQPTLNETSKNGPRGYFDPATNRVQQQKADGLHAQDESRIRAWLSRIEETDPVIIRDVIERCRSDLEARQYCLRCADVILRKDSAEKPITCGRCIHFERADHLHLGHCARGEPEAVGGLWDTDQRWCAHFISSARSNHQRPIAPNDALNKEVNFPNDFG